MSDDSEPNNSIGGQYPATELTEGATYVQAIRLLLLDKNPFIRTAGVTKLRELAPLHSEVDQELKTWAERCCALQECELYTDRKVYDSSDYLTETAYHNKDLIEAVLSVRQIIMTEKVANTVFRYYADKDVLGLGFLPQLEAFTFAFTSKSDMANWFSRLKLKALRFCHCSGGLFEDIGHMTELEELSIEFHTEMASLPASVAHCRSLKILTLIDSEINQLPEVVHFKLEELHIENCKSLNTDELPKWVQDVPTVRY